MQYAVVRVIENSQDFQRPSGGRKLSNKPNATFPQRNGFGFEEWNFNKELLIGGQIWGYHYYIPAKKHANDLFTLYFVTYEAKKWRLVGIYRDARHMRDTRPWPTKIVHQKARDLFALRDQLGPGYHDKSLAELKAVLRPQAVERRWAVAADDAQIIQGGVPIPDEISFQHDFRKNFRETRPTLLQEVDALRLDGLVSEPRSGKALVTIHVDSDEAVLDLDYVATEGGGKWRMHFARERNRTIVRQKKAQVLKDTGTLKCECCQFDFAKHYGTLGKGFCEVHHKKPLAKVPKNGLVKTAIDDLSIVCSNCHRMLHASGKLQTVQQITDLRKARKPMA